MVSKRLLLSKFLSLGPLQVEEQPEQGQESALELSAVLPLEQPLASQSTGTSDLRNNAISVAAQHLQGKVMTRAAPSMEDIATEVGVTEKNMRIHLCAAAEQALRFQESFPSDTLQVVDRLSRGQVWKAVALIEHCLYDETPLVVSTNFAGQRAVQRAKVFVLETDWCVLLRDMSGTHPSHGPTAHSRDNIQQHVHSEGSYLCITGKRSPMIRALERATGEGILPLLRSTSLSKSLGSIDFCWRLAECDECPANVRAEKLVSLENPRQTSAVFLCAAHKIHASAEKTWQLPHFETLLSGLLHCGLVLREAASNKTLHNALYAEIMSRPLRMSTGELASTPEEQEFRQQMLRLFGPPSHEPRRSALAHAVAQYVLNGDWRSEALQHFCSEHCHCQTEEDARRLICTSVTKLLTAMHPGVFIKKDWKSWQQHLRGYGLLQSMHGLFSSAFVRAFGRLPLGVFWGPGLQAEAADDAAAHVAAAPQHIPRAFDQEADPFHQMDAGVAGAGAVDAEAGRLRNMVHQKESVLFMKETHWIDDLILLFESLAPEVSMMLKFLGSTSAEWEQRQQQKLIAEEPRSWRVLEWQKQKEIRNMLQTSAVSMHDAGRWRWMADTEHFRSKLLRSSMRPGSVVYQLLAVRVRGYPFKLFRLLETPSHEAAQVVINTPACLLDPLTRDVLCKFPTAEMLSAATDVLQVLAASALMLATTTFSSERAHSKNARRARATPSTHPKMIETLALSSAGWSGPSWLQPPKPKKPSKRRGRPSKKTKSASISDMPIDDKGEADQSSDRKGVKRRRGGGGGAWRAFVHDEVVQRGASNDFKLLAEKYANLSPARKQFYRELGALGFRWEKKKSCWPPFLNNPTSLPRNNYITSSPVCIKIPEIPSGSVAAV